MVVAIDGPAGAGKSTVAKLLAERLSFSYLDTGALYRAATLKVIDENIDISDCNRVAAVVKGCKIYFSEDGSVLLDGRDVTERIRQPFINKSLSEVARNPSVRKFLGELQRKIAEGNNVVVEGRDSTTVVFPDAECKIYLDASIKVRAKRRHRELVKKGIEAELIQVEESIRKRDFADISRKDGPLKRAEDAVYVDTSDLTIEEVVKVLKGIVEERANVSRG